MNTKFENLSTTERLARFLISFVTIVVIMESAIVGSALFAVLSIIMIALATTAIVGWDPIKSVSLRTKLLSSGSGVDHTQKHA